MAEITQVSGSGGEEPDRGGTEPEKRSRTKKSTAVDFGLRGARNPSVRPDPVFSPDRVKTRSERWGIQFIPPRAPGTLPGAPPKAINIALVQKLFINSELTHFFQTLVRFL